MQSSYFINLKNPETLALAISLRCAPTEELSERPHLLKKAHSILKVRLVPIEKHRFSMLYPHHSIASFRIINLAASYLKLNPDATDEKILLWLFGNKEHPQSAYMLTQDEERLLIGAYQSNPSSAMGIALSLFSPKIVAILNKADYAINPNNKDDVEAACLISLTELLSSFDLNKHSHGIPQNLISLSTMNAICEVFASEYSVSLHRRQIHYIQKLYCMMQDPDFSSLSQKERAKKADVPLEIVEIYDTNDTENFDRNNRRNPLSSDLEKADAHKNVPLLGHTSFLSTEEVELLYDLDLMGDDPFFLHLRDIVSRQVQEHPSRPSAAGRKIWQDWTKAKMRLHVSDEDFDIYMILITAWMERYGIPLQFNKE